MPADSKKKKKEKKKTEDEEGDEDEDETEKEKFEALEHEVELKIKNDVSNFFLLENLNCSAVLTNHGAIESLKEVPRHFRE